MQGVSLVFGYAKHHIEPGFDKRGANLEEPDLMLLELIDCIPCCERFLAC